MGINMHEVPIIIIEIHRDKAYPDKDVSKIQMMACWALAYTDKCYGILIKKLMTDLFVFTKHCKTAKITTDKYTVNLGGSFCLLVSLLVQQLENL